MLAPSELTAAQLEISEDERLVLAAVRDDLRNGSITSIDNPGNSFRLLSMTTWLDFECGTVGCIAGHAYMMSGKRAFADVIKSSTSPDRPDHVVNLFLPPVSIMQRNDPLEIADGIDRFLKTGDAGWPEGS